MTPSALRDLAADVLARHIARILVDGSRVCVVEYPNAPWPCDAVALANAVGPLAVLAEFAGDHIDDEPCRFDHHGGCQAHAYLDLRPGEVCPMVEARAALRALEAGT